MTVRRKKKSRKMRGSRSHGWGFGKRHRGTGNQGGAGFAGVGKRGGAKKTYYLSKHILPIGKHGMSITRKLPRGKAINIIEIEQKLDSWLKDKLIEKEKDMFVIDLSKLGYEKFLSTGKVNKKLKIICAKYSKSAKEKLEGAGGILEVKA